jgi:hypothetical protein
MAHLFPFMASNAPAFRCPARGKEFEWTTLSRNGHDFPVNMDPNTRFSYGYNAPGAGNVGGCALSITQGARVSVSQIRNPADMIAIGDSDGNGARDAEIAYFRLMATQLPLLTPGNHHRSGGNIVFCDRHLEWQKQAKWIELTESAARHWNNDNQPHLEIWIGGKRFCSGMRAEEPRRCAREPVRSIYTSQNSCWSLDLLYVRSTEFSRSRSCDLPSYFFAKSPACF